MGIVSLAGFTVLYVFGGELISLKMIRRRFGDRHLPQWGGGGAGDDPENSGHRLVPAGPPELCPLEPFASPGSPPSAPPGGLWFLTVPPASNGADLLV